MIKVKALEFEEYARGYYRCDAGIGYWYWVGIYYGGSYLAEWSREEKAPRNAFKSSPCSSLDDAKAACQAHHEQHVLSMITEVADGAE